VTAASSSSATPGSFVAVGTPGGYREGPTAGVERRNPPLRGSHVMNNFA
jgi:hypothetical protein